MHNLSPTARAFRLPPYKWGVYLLVAVNTLGCAFYSNYFFFLLRDVHGFGDRALLGLNAVHGCLYVAASLFAGKFGQRRGYFTSLRVGFLGMALGMSLGFCVSPLLGQLAAFGCWTILMCFTWPMLEALASEHEPAAALPHRLGLYNVLWAFPAAVAFFCGGFAFKYLGRSSLYWLPAVFFLFNFCVTFPLKRRHDLWLAGQAMQPLPEAGHGVSPVPLVRPVYFLKLAWIANPFAYVAVQTITAMIPGIARKVELGVAQAGVVMSVWFLVRAAAFVMLWAWGGWHYRFRWFIGSFALLLVSFVTLVLTRDVPTLVLAQVGFGFATGLLYYSSLFYSMDGSESKGEHGGVHEALIGAGICGGPAIGAASLWLVPGVAAAPAIAVGTVLVIGAGLVIAVRNRYRS